MRKIIIISLVVLSCITGFAQSSDPKIKRLEQIYRSLEYNTTSFNDLKKTWIVTDPVFVREIFNKFVVKNALRIHGKRPSVRDIEENSDYIYNGSVFIDLRKRYYDDEIEILRFFKENRIAGADTTDYFFDAVQDFVFIKEILGEVLYADLKKQGYALNDITKTNFDYKPSYNFDMCINGLEPELMFWNATTDKRNKYFVSLMGRWGNDHVTLPGWYHPEYIIGVKVNYVDSLENNKEGYTYIGEIGLGAPATQPDLGFDDNFTGRKLEHTGNSFYFKFISKSLGFITPEIEDMELQLTGLFSLGTKKPSDFSYTAPTAVYSTRNYFDIFCNWKNLTRLSDLGNFHAGAGISGFDTKAYLIDPAAPALSVINAKEKNGFKMSLYGEAGLSNVGSLLTHSFAFQTNYNFNEKLVLLGLKLNLMISNSLGIDFRIMTPIKAGASQLPAYRSDTYLVFSPVIRINY